MTTPNGKKDSRGRLGTGKQMSDRISFTAAEQYGILLDTDEDRLIDTRPR